MLKQYKHSTTNYAFQLLPAALVIQKVKEVKNLLVTVTGSHHNSKQGLDLIEPVAEIGLL